MWVDAMMTQTELSIILVKSCNLFVIIFLIRLAMHSFPAASRPGLTLNDIYGPKFTDSQKYLALFAKKRKIYEIQI